MKVLEGKTPAERNKTIAAIVLGGLAVLALSYTFLFSGSPSKPAAKTTVVTTPKDGKTVSTTVATTEVAQIKEPIPDNEDYLITPVSYSLAGIGAPDASRNIFALFDPSSVPPRPVVVSTPKPEVFVPLPTPTPAPPPPLMITGISPQAIYARTGNFNLSVDGDRFTPESKIYFNGSELPTQFQSPQRLTAVVPSNLVENEGERQILVRTPDNSLFSNVGQFNVQAPPVPNFTFVGLVARKRFNNDEAKLQNKQTKEYISVRLNDSVPDRFRVASISASEVVVIDTQLKLKHRLLYSDNKLATSGGSQPGGASNNGFNNGVNGGSGVPNPYGNNPQQEFQGIPSNIPRYIPPPPPSNQNDDEDDDQP